MGGGWYAAIRRLDRKVQETGACGLSMRVMLCQVTIRWMKGKDPKHSLYTTTVVHVLEQADVVL